MSFNILPGAKFSMASKTKTSPAVSVSLPFSTRVAWKNLDNMECVPQGFEQHVRVCARDPERTDSVGSSKSPDVRSPRVRVSSPSA